MVSCSMNAARYFLDPRNGLDAYHALMFEKLTYNPSETLQEGKRMLAETEMSGIEPQLKKTGPNSTVTVQK